MVIRITEENFDKIALKLQDELANIIKNSIDVNDYQLIMYKYLFISELKIPVHEELGLEIDNDSFILYVIPDDFKLTHLMKLDDAFDKFNASFMANQYNLLKLRFKLCD